MTSPATTSSIDVAYWFFDRAEQDGFYLENEKLHHLLFIAQCEYAKKYYNSMLMPCVFLCDEKGFFEPNLQKMFLNGRPFMPKVSFDNKVSAFLENIWLKFNRLSIMQLKQIITSSPLYTDTYQKDMTNVLHWHSVIDKYNECGTIQDSIDNTYHPKKVLVSQNGPVIVSKWKPRKVNIVS